MKNRIILAILVSFIFVLGGCGSNDKNHTGTNTGTTVTKMQKTKIIVNPNGVDFSLAIPFNKNSGYNVVAELKNFALDVIGCEIDTVSYAPPSVLLNGDESCIGRLYISGKFKNQCTPGGYSLTYDEKVTLGSTSKTTSQTETYDYSNPTGGETNPDKNGYNFYNATTPMQITQVNTAYKLKVQLLKDAYPAAGKKIRLKSFSSAYGRVDSYEATTGSDGYAVFDYTSPSSMPYIGSYAPLTMTFLDEEANATEPMTQEIDLQFRSNTEAGNEYNLTNITTPLVVRTSGEVLSISADVVDANGIGVPDQNVSITAISGVKYGSIISASRTTTDTSGHAFFSYKAPVDIAAVNKQSTKVTISMTHNDKTYTRDAYITFDKLDTNTTTPMVVITNSYKEISLNQNSQSTQIEVQVFRNGTNTPYAEGNVKVSLPNKVITGSDVGSFAKYEVKVGSNGRAVFSYTGPSDLKSLVDSGDKNSTFEFYHEANPTQKEAVLVKYNLSGAYEPSKYFLTTPSNDGNYTMGLESQKQFTIYLKDDQGTKVDDADIKSIKIETQNASVGKLIDVNDDGNEKISLALNGTDAINAYSFPIKTYTLSGLLPIKVTVEFTDANGDSQSIDTIMNIVVYSGPPTALSISYAGVKQDDSNAKYIEQFAVTVTDEYSNPVNTQPYMSAGGMVEYAVDGSSSDGVRTTSSPRLWHGKNDTHGKLEATGGNKAQLTTAGDTFNYADVANDKVVIFGRGYAYEAFGKWDIDSSGNRVLVLKDDYYGSTRDGVYLAVGHNNREDLCSADARQYVGNVRQSNFQLDETGHALVEFEYDYQLTGKDIMLWVNLNGYQASSSKMLRIGDAKKHTLRGAGFVSPENYTLPSNASASTYHFRVHHENAPEWYRNGHFAFAVVGTCKVENIVDWSNRHDARECSNTVGYVDLNVSNPSADECTINIDNIATSSEFDGVN